MQHLIGILFDPKNEWVAIKNNNASVIKHYYQYIFIIALLPTYCWYYGSTTVGWAIGSSGYIKLTSQSAFEIMGLFYLSILVGVLFLGFMIHWMSETYEASNSSVSKGVGIAAYACAPMFLIGLTGMYPILWLDIILGCLASGFTIYLLYIGVPIMLDIPKERGFLYASAMVAVGLVMCAAFLGITAILWGLGAMPIFTD